MGCIEGSKDAEEERLKKDANKKIEKQIQKDKQIYRATHRLLLLGKRKNVSRENKNMKERVLPKLFIATATHRPI